jgi:1-acyl-sn-glycerol-3-phosphate acyltransferase
LHLRTSSHALIDLAARPIQLQGSAFAAAVLRAAGWRVIFDGLPSKQGVLILYPHTSNWDFVVTMLGRWSIGLDVAFWSKDSLFRVPLLGRFVRAVGGVPVDRTNPRGAVASMADEMRRAREQGRHFWLALTPEGSRSRGTAWRSGFYQVALQADVPLGLGFIDAASRTMGVDTFIRLTGDVDADMATIERHLGGRRGIRPEGATPIRLDADPAPHDRESPGRSKT